MKKLENYEDVRVYVKGVCELSELEDFISWFKENYNSAVEIYEKYINEVAIAFFENCYSNDRVNIAKNMIDPKLEEELNSKNEKGYEFYLDLDDDNRISIFGRTRYTYRDDRKIRIHFEWKK